MQRIHRNYSPFFLEPSTQNQTPTGHVMNVCRIITSKLWISAAGQQNSTGGPSMAVNWVLNNLPTTLYIRCPCIEYSWPSMGSVELTWPSVWGKWVSVPESTSRGAHEMQNTNIGCHRLSPALKENGETLFFFVNLKFLIHSSKKTTTNNLWTWVCNLTKRSGVKNRRFDSFLGRI